MSTRRKRGFYGSATVVLLLGVSVLAGCWASARSKVAGMLSTAHLSSLPSSATNIAYYQWNGLFTGETYAKFEMNAEDMRAFISNSPSLQSAQPKEIYDREHQHLPYPKMVSDSSSGPHYYFQHPKFPDWYDLTIHGNGRKYFLWPDKYVYIDEERNIVWLRFIKG